MSATGCNSTKAPNPMDRRKLKLALHRVRAEYGRSFCASPAVCQPVGAAPAVPDKEPEEVDIAREADIAIAAYRHEQANSAAGPPQLHLAPGLTCAQFEHDMRTEAWYDPEYGKTWEEERETKPSEVEEHTVKKPTVQARGMVDRSKYRCWSCGLKAAHDVQLPTEVFAVAYMQDGPAGAIRALKAFAEALVKRDYEEAVARTACCRQLQCMIAQGKLTPENYEAWRFSGKRDEVTGEVIAPPRNQLERGTERMDQGVVLSDNILLLRWIFLLSDEAEGEAPVLSKAEITALFHWVILNSRFVQEREMRYIATALAIVESASFPFAFVDAQSFVDKMSGVPRTYCFRRLLEHIFDTQRDVYHWQSWGNRLLETAFPKAADTSYLLACRENWIARGRPLDEKGRPVHRVAAHEKRLQAFFTGSGFKKALQEATSEHPSFDLYYASSCSTKNTLKGAKAQSRDETRALLKAISGSHRSGPLKANSVRDRKCAPTDGAHQADSSVHTEQRYDGACEGLGLDAQEKAETLALVIVKHTKGNSVGKEKLQGANADNTKSKACAVLRPVEIWSPPQPRQTQARADVLERLAGLVPLKRRKLGAGWS
jgi:hypothetical protein